MSTKGGYPGAAGVRGGGCGRQEGRMEGVQMAFQDKDPPKVSGMTRN